MKKIFMALQIFFLSILTVSCGIKQEPITPKQYVEEKTEKSTSFLNEEYGRLLDSCILDNGDTYALYCKKQDGEDTFTVTKQLKDSLSVKIIPLQCEESVSWLFICADTSGNILVGDTVTLYLFNESGEFFQKFPAWPAGGMIITDDQAVICQNYSDSPYYIFDLSTGANKGVFLEKEFLFSQGKSQPFLGGFYGREMLITSAGLYVHNENSWILQVPANGTSMSKAGFSATGIESGMNETYVVYDFDFQYTYSLKEINEDENDSQITLRVTAWQDRSTLRTALAEYQIANPDITIEYAFRCTDLPETEQEANILLQITNAEIVSSQAADLYVLDYLPWEKYQEKNLLLDLSEIVAPYVENEEYFGNILTAYKTEDGLFAVPWFFSTKFILCKQELIPYVQSIHKLAGFLEKHPEDPGLIPYYYRDMPELFLAMIYDFYGNDLYENGTITLENIKEFLISARIIYDRQQENVSDTLLPDYSKDSFTYSHLRQYPCGKDIQLLFEEQDGSFLLLPSTPMGIIDLLEANHHPDYALVPIDGIHAQFLFGIHSGSKKQESAKDLLKYLISYFEETGTADRSIDMFVYLPGIPIYKPILSGRTEFYIHEGANNPLYNYTSDDTEWLLGLMEQFQKPGYSADTVTDDACSVFAKGSQGYLTGDRTLEKAADEIYNGFLLLYYENQ